MALAALAGGVAWIARRETTPVASQPSPTITPTKPVSLEAKAEAVQAVVVANNAAANAQEKAFVDNGWTLTTGSSPPPDPALLSLSPSLLPSREAELRGQLLSAAPARQHLANAIVIATEAKAVETRTAAIAAIAGMGRGDPQHALVSLGKKLGKDDPARGAAIRAIRPVDLDDPFVITHAALLDDAAFSPDEKKQLASALAHVVLVGGGALPADVTLSPSARVLFDAALTTARN